MISELQLALSSSIYFNSASFVLIGWRQHCATLLRYYELSSYNVPLLHVAHFLCHRTHDPTLPQVHVSSLLAF